ncbi:non-ribosomal peptide synthetase [Streptomyces sp. NPDC090029]|uniref:non-ribosomal peptide synthetase n=1 Tax=Streptomyces sp. NPDC090029 TaxID=3365924 RepID=UPI003825959C
MSLSPAGGRPAASQASTENGGPALWRAADGDERLTVIERVAQWAIRTPLATALIEDGVEISYAELVGRSAEMARQIARYADPGAVVGASLPRSAAGVTAMLGAWWAGCAYLALDPMVPATRRAAMIEAARPAVLIQPTEGAGEADSTGPVPVLTVPTEAPVRPLMKVESWDPPLASPSRISYLVFTSGSTGEPKGVEMGEPAFRHLVQWHTEQEGLSGPRTAHVAAVGFDVALQEVAATLCTGGTLVVIDEATRRAPNCLLAELRRHEVRRIFLPTAALQLIAEEAARLTDQELPRLSDVVCAGDQLRITPAVRRFFSRMAGCRLHNHYGPAETHVITAWTACGDPDTWPDRAPIGRPLPHVEVELAATGDDMPEEGCGELIVHGDRVARGYVGRADLTAARFVLREGRRGYRTGDLVVWEDGSLVFCGRRDRQVKIEGFRVELDEVETHLSQHPVVAECVVDAVPDDSGEKELVAFVVVRAGEAGVPPGHREFRAFLAERLPAFMIPLRYQVLERIPTTVNGKLDRRALTALAAAPAVPAAGGADGAAGAETTQGDLTALVRNAYAQALGHGDFRAHENFFDLGGTSLRAATVRAVLEERLGRTIPVVLLYNHPTVNSLVETLESESSELVPSTRTGHRPPRLARRSRQSALRQQARRSR